MNIREAAAERSKNVRQMSHRPQERSALPTVRSGHVGFASEMSLRADEEGTGSTFEGYASTYEQPYEMFDMYGPYTEVISQGAGSTSLNRSDLDVPLVLNHESIRRIARTTNGTLSLTEDDHGLHVLAPNLDLKDYDVAYIAPKIQARHITEMSFKFLITKGHWSPDYTEYRIEEFDLHRGDVSIVGYGANPNTSGSLRSDERERSRMRLDLALARD